MKHLTVTVSLLLLVQTLGLVSLQTTPPSLTVNSSWLRKLATDANAAQGNVVEETEQENGVDFTSGTSSGAMEDENMIQQRVGATEVTTHPNATESPVLQKVTVKTTEAPRSNTTASPAATNAATPIQTATTEAANNVSSTPTPQNVTAVPDSSSRGKTTSAPGTTTTTTTTAKPDGESKNSTEFSDSTAATNNTETEMNETSTRPPTVSVSPEIPATTAAEVQTDESTGDTAGRGSVLDPQRNARQQAWGAVLTTAVAVACVGLAVYIIMKKKYPKGFSHRKLVEEYPSDPVLRLDNSEPLDLNFGHLGYHNPGHQGDDIQMGRIPRRQN